MGHVNDFASVVDPVARAEMEDLLTRLRSATGAEIAVVTLPTIDDRDEAEVALAIGRKWGVGARAEIGDQRRNAGMVVLLVPRQNHQPGTGHVRIEVGQGLEGIVTDAASGQIRRDVMGPLLAQEQYGAALDERRPGSDRARGPRLRRHRLYAGLGACHASRRRDTGSPFLQFLPLLLFIVFIAARQPGPATAPGILGRRPVDRRRRLGWWRLRRGRGRWVRWLRRRRRVQRRRIGGTVLMHETVDRVVIAFSRGRRRRAGRGLQRAALRLGRARRLPPRPLQHQPDAGAR